jgi:broad specificity phosphatase PhoE/predicted kinase
MWRGARPSGSIPTHGSPRSDRRLLAPLRTIPMDANDRPPEPESQARPRLCVALVGLPARGKSYTAAKVLRYMSWLGHEAKVFNVGNYRRERLGAAHPHTWFDPQNEEAAAEREALSDVALTDMMAWLDSSGDVAVFDAANITRERRRRIREACAARDIPCQFVEIVCDDPSLIEFNIRETKIYSLDYDGFEAKRAAEDFRLRIRQYEKAYEPVGAGEGSFIRLTDGGRRVQAHNPIDFPNSRLISLLMNLHIVQRPVWLTRHGESLFNQTGRIGGDEPLSPRGREYAESLGHYVNGHFGRSQEVVVWTSTLRRTIETAAHIGRRTVRKRELDEIRAGVCDGMTYAEIEKTLPEEFAARKHDKLGYRYPQGESYLDIIHRVDPVVIEIERQRRPVVIVGHQAILRAIYAYLIGKPAVECPFLEVPLHTVIELTPHNDACEERRIGLKPYLG